MISGDRALAEGKYGAFYNTLEEFHKYWDRIDIICPRTTNYKLQTTNLFGNVFIHPSPWPLIMQPFWILKRGKQIYKEQKFNLMTVHEYPPFYNGIGARLLWNKIRVPYVLEIHHIPGLPKAAGFKERFYKNMTEFLIRADSIRAKAIRAVNKKQVPDFLIKAGVPREKIVFIPSLYIDLNVFQPMRLDKKYDLVFAARLEKNKGILNLIEAIRIAKKQKPDIKLLIIGSGPELSRIKLLTTHYSLQTNIIFSGWLETLNDVVRAYNSAKIFINPSLNEGGPRVALEAMACGLPVITTKVGTMLDVVSDGENGLFGSWEPDEIADKIALLLEKKGLQEKFSQAGIEIAKRFEKVAAIKNYADELKKIIST